MLPAGMPALHGSGAHLRVAARSHHDLRKPDRAVLSHSTPLYAVASFTSSLTKVKPFVFCDHQAASWSGRGTGYLLRQIRMEMALSVVGRCDSSSRRM
jgi:hypothetical protein